MCLFSRHHDHFAQRITAYSSSSLFLYIFHSDRENIIFYSCFNFTKGFVVIIFDSFFQIHKRIKVNFINQLLTVQKTEALQIIRGYKWGVPCWGHLHQRSSVLRAFNSRGERFIWKVKKNYSDGKTANSNTAIT